MLCFTTFTTFSQSKIKLLTLTVNLTLLYFLFTGPLIKKDRVLQGMPHVALALYLLSERVSGQSFWKPYIGILLSVAI